MNYIDTELLGAALGYQGVTLLGKVKMENKPLTTGLGPLYYLICVASCEDRGGTGEITGGAPL